MDGTSSVRPESAPSPARAFVGSRLGSADRHEPSEHTSTTAWEAAVG
jgi:hypothetical protein